MGALLTAKAALLQALAEPGYGLDLIERVRRSTAGFVDLKMGSLYPALRALERARLVKAREAPEGRGRPRRYYELTLAGVKAAMAQREALAGFLRSRAGSRPADLARMRERLEATLEVSAFVRSLREGVLAGQRTRT
jgi:PadR family transcriptional regulator PadR